MKLSNTSAFEEDAIAALEWTLEQFGISARDRYSELIETTLLAISEDPLLRGSREFQEVRLYHLRHSNKAAAVNGIIVKNPRHFVAYRDRSDTIEVLRLLHDRMDIEYPLGNDD